MFWADKFASQIIKSGQHKPYWVDDMKTPSGRIHVGALRGVIIHDLISKCLAKKEVKVTNTYVFNDMDPMDGFPTYLPKKFRQHMGKPLFQIPSPESGYKSMADCYGQQFIDTFNKLGAKPKIIWSSQYYQQGKFNQVIKESLDKVAKIRHYYHEISDYDKPKNWYPFQVICPQCGKVGTTIVTAWDGEKVTFVCQPDLVEWAAGCGYKGKISPFDGTGKLMWKVDWAAHWKVIGITIEGAGKDHMTEGGSHDLSGAICKKVFNYPIPFSFIYEWFLARGGTKMSSSKGIGISAKEISQTIPPYLLRFLLVKTNYRKAIIFDPNNNQSILNLFDEYDSFADVYYSKKKENDQGRIWQLSQVNKIPDKKPFYPRFRDVVNYIQSPSVDIFNKFAQIKGSLLTSAEAAILKERIKYAKIWIKTYAPKELTYQVKKDITEEAASLSDEQKQYLTKTAYLLKKKIWEPEELQQALYKLSKEIGLPAKKAFQAIYLALIGKTHGPKAAWLILDQNICFVSKRFELFSKNKKIENKNKTTK